MPEPHLHFHDELDALSFLMLKGENNPHTRSSMLSIMMLDRTPDFSQLQRTFERASRSFIRLRQHVVIPSVNITSPRWIVDPDFDLDFHVKKVTAPAPGGMSEVLDFSNHFLASALDLTRPLWEVILLDGINVDGCKSALLMKLHHSVTDGMGGLQLFEELFDLDPNATERPMPPLPIPEELSGEELVKQSLRHGIGKLVPQFKRTVSKSLRKGSEWLNNPKETLDNLQLQIESAKRVMGPSPVPPSPLLRPRSLGRRLSTIELPLADLRAAAKACDATVNDAYLAATSSALRRYHNAKGIEIDQLAISMPVNQRKMDDDSGGNHFAGARVILPIAEVDPRKRMDAIRSDVKKATQEPAINIFHYIAPILAKLPDSTLERATSGIQSPEVQISNIPGAPVPMYINGCRAVKMLPFGPVPGVALMLTMISMAGTCFVGAHYDTAAFTDPELFDRCLQEGFDEVVAITKTAARKPRAKSTPSNSRAATPKKASPRKAAPKKAAPKKTAPPKSPVKESAPKATTAPAGDSL